MKNEIMERMQNGTRENLNAFKRSVNRYMDKSPIHFTSLLKRRITGAASTVNNKISSAASIVNNKVSETADTLASSLNNKVAETANTLVDEAEWWFNQGKRRGNEWVPTPAGRERMTQRALQYADAAAFFLAPHVALRMLGSANPYTDFAARTYLTATAFRGTYNALKNRPQATR